MLFGIPVPIGQPHRDVMYTENSCLRPNLGGILQDLCLFSEGAFINSATAFTTAAAEPVPAVH